MNWILAMEPLLISLLGLLLIAVGAWIVYRLSYEMWLSGTEQGFSAGYHRCREDWAEEIDAGCKVLGWDRADEEIEDRMMNGCA